MNDEEIRKHAQKRAESLENFIALYVLETGLKPSEIVLIEERSEDGRRIIWYCKPIKEIITT